MNTSIIRIVLIVSLYFIITFVKAQKTAVFDDPAKDYKEALELYDQQKYNIAFNRFCDFLETYKELDDSQSYLLIADAYYYKAACAFKQKDIKTEDFYLFYIDRFKGHSFANNANNDLGSWYFSQSNFKDALAYYKKVNDRALSKKFYEEFSFKRGFCYFSLKDFTAAKTAWMEVINANESQYYYMANYYYGLASYYNQEYDEAILSFKKAEKDAKYKTVIPYYITQISFLEKKYQDVIDYGVPISNQKDLKNKENIDQLIGQSYFELKNYSNAVKYLSAYEQKAKQLTKEDYYQLGYAQYQIGDYNGVVTNFKQLNHLNDALAQNALYLTGNAYLKLKDKENARNALQSASALNYNPVIIEESKFNYAKLSYELSFNNDALISIRKFIEEYPQSKHLEEANEVLANVLLETKNYNEAITIIDQMKNPTPKIQAVYQLMAYHKAISLYNSEDFNGALESLNKAERYTPDKSILALTHYWRGDIYHRKNEYTKSISEISEFLKNIGLVSIEPNNKANLATGQYVQGYNYYKLKDYGKAKTSFEESAKLLESNSNPELKASLLPDALLRTADCEFLQKNYNSSINYYDKVIQKGYEGADYAFFQKGIIEGLKENYEVKIDQLRKVISVYPQSLLVDDARFEIGATFVLQEKFDPAILTFNELIEKHTKSEWIAPTYLKLGLIYFNQNNYEESLKRYKTVVSRFPKTTASTEALTAIKDVYIAKGDPDGYIKYIGNIPNASITTSQQDSVLYLSAENQFTKGEYDKALKSFNDYLARFPNGHFSMSSHFYRGECHFSFQDFDKAITDYNYVLNDIQNRFTERSLSRAAGINFYHFKNFQEARLLYSSLIQIATTEDNKMSAILGLLRTNSQLNDYAASIDFANQIIKGVGFSEIQQTEAIYYRARSYWESGNKELSVADYSNVRKRTINEWAAEAAYYMAKYLLDKNQLTEAEAACFDFIKNYPSYSTWLVQTYLLLADVYVKQGNLFKAKATVQSILNNYTKQDEWRKRAEDKYAEIEGLEAKNSKIIDPNIDDSQFQFEDNN